jgi:hypothetical protein
MNLAMRFTIERRRLTDDHGKPLRVASAAEFFMCDADSVHDALTIFIRGDEAEVVGNVLTFPGFQAIATVRKEANVYTLQVGPASDSRLRL